MGGKKEIYRDVRFFHGALQLWLPWSRVLELGLCPGKPWKVVEMRIAGDKFFDDL